MAHSYVGDCGWCPASMARSRNSKFQCVESGYDLGSSKVHSQSIRPLWTRITQSDSDETGTNFIVSITQQPSKYPSWILLTELAFGRWRPCCLSFPAGDKEHYGVWMWGFASKMKEHFNLRWRILHVCGFDFHRDSVLWTSLLSQQFPDSIFRSQLVGDWSTTHIGDPLAMDVC